MLRAAWFDVDPPLIMAASAALLSIYNVKESDLKRYRRVEIAATAVNSSRPKMTDVSSKQSISPTVAVLVIRATNPAVGREECGSTLWLNNTAANPDSRGPHRRHR